MKVLLDTSGLLMIRWVDIFAELERLGYLEYLVPQAVCDELEGLRKTLKGRDREMLNLVRLLLERCKVIEGKGKADDIILEIATREGVAVLTNDRELSERLREKGVRVVSLRQKKYLFERG
ncbi:MAG: DNA-binding protein [Candidatus Syntrophoarchaeum caldarius]|uniref:DNA-binding protein n=1 Tax=Candidatus Syntropharchaeum caldarium TaxID=1838285 RepID=A0A1F2P9X2_9EURY|nr:MAG: DNA-binding protein [Candidatus Syntrophoarchaeum caldarius]